MKIKKTSVNIIFILGCFLFAACSEPGQDEQLTAMTHEGAGTLSFLKNDAVWLAQIPYITGESPDAHGEILRKGTDSAFLMISARGRIKGKSSETVAFIFPRFKFSVGTYKTADTPVMDWSSGTLDPAKFPFTDSTVLIGYGSDGATRNAYGTITIAYLDSTKVNTTIVAGTFNFSVFNESSKDSIRCTNGRFDVFYGHN